MTERNLSRFSTVQRLLLFAACALAVMLLALLDRIPDKHMGSPHAGSVMQVPRDIPVGSDGWAAVPVAFVSNGLRISGALFSIDYDETCLVFDPIDACLLYTSDAADERSSEDLGDHRIIKKKQKDTH